MTKRQETNQESNDSRKTLILKARAEEVKHALRTQLQKEKKHQWYIYRKKNFPNSRDTKMQVKVEADINPVMPPSSGNKIPITSVIVAGVGLCCAYLYIGRHLH